MQKEKEIQVVYESPEAEIIDVALEINILSNEIDPIPIDPEI